MGFSLKKVAKAVTNTVKDVVLAPVTVPVAVAEKVGIKSDMMNDVVAKLDSAYSAPSKIIDGESARQSFTDWASLIKQSGSTLGLPASFGDIKLPDMPDFNFGDFGLGDVLDNVLKTQLNKPTPTQPIGQAGVTKYDPFYSESTGYQLPLSSSDNKTPIIVGVIVFVVVLVIIVMKRKK